MEKLYKMQGSAVYIDGESSQCILSHFVLHKLLSLDDAICKTCGNQVIRTGTIYIQKHLSFECCNTVKFFDWATFSSQLKEQRMLYSSVVMSSTRDVSAKKTRSGSLC